MFENERKLLFDEMADLESAYNYAKSHLDELIKRSRVTLSPGYVSKLVETITAVKSAKIGAIRELANLSRMEEELRLKIRKSEGGEDDQARLLDLFRSIFQGSQVEEENRLPSDEDVDALLEARLSNHDKPAALPAPVDRVEDAEEEDGERWVALVCDSSGRPFVVDSRTSEVLDGYDLSGVEITVTENEDGELVAFDQDGDQIDIVEIADGEDEDEDEEEREPEEL